MANVALCVPHAGKISPLVTRALLTMQGNYTQHQFTYIEIDSVIIGKARNLMVELALAQNVDVIVMIDDDVLVPGNMGELIDQALVLDIVSGVYYNRRMPYTPQIFERAVEHPDDYLYWPIIDFPETDKPFKVDAIGSGCVAVKTTVFKKMLEFHTAKFEAVSKELANHPDIAYIVKFLSPWYEFLNHKGEDMYFCERAHEAGFDVWVDPRIQCEHLSEIAITKEHFQYLKDNKTLVKEVHQ